MDTMKLPLYTKEWKAKAEALGLTVSVEFIQETKLDGYGVERKSSWSRYVMTVTNGVAKIVTIQRHQSGAYKSKALYWAVPNGSQENVLLKSVDGLMEQMARGLNK